MHIFLLFFQISVERAILSMLVFLVLFWMYGFFTGLYKIAAATAECLFIATPFANRLRLIYWQGRDAYSAAAEIFLGFSFLDSGLRIDSPVNVRR